MGELAWSVDLPEAVSTPPALLFSTTIRALTLAKLGGEPGNRETYPPK